ncbi:hypothetical protein K432DRAFT_407702 [Lepidopterella palustris CBS 459.81]|uniref:Transmembrane protein n=1 Tax=Lepidopterella palustris CBS 459.81 TaxID=1314670 RepID=A0A8E2JC62_9PEZI|nr:hypothetical protein K432DRAFT_407702 [Lepidopterella palustris CBS 459.81]
MALRIPIVLLSACVWRALAIAAPSPEAQITPAPLLPRQNDAAFMGYFSTDGTWSSLDCDPGLTWYQSGDYAQCCPTTIASCLAPTGCISGSQIYPWSGSVTTIACTDNYDNLAWSVCNTIFIYENTADSNPHTDIVCGKNAVNWSYYRQTPTTPSTSSETPSSTTSGAAATSTSASPTPAPVHKSSKAWIAGAVVGPLLGLALIGAIVFFLTRKKPAPPAPPVQPNQPQQISELKPGTGPYQPQPVGYQPEYVQPGYQPTSPGQMSPVPLYQAPYSPPGSPPPVEAPTNTPAYAYNGVTPEKSPVVVNQHMQSPQPLAAELSGDTSRR